MRPSRLRAVLICTGVTLALSTGWSAASAAVSHSVAPAAATAAGAHGGVLGGTGGTAVQVPGIATLNQGGDAEVGSVSCASAGNCSAGGFYAGKSGLSSFVVSEP